MPCRCSLPKLFSSQAPKTRGNMSAWQMCPAWSTEKIRAPDTYPNALRRTCVESSAAYEKPCIRETGLAQKAGEAAPDQLGSTIRIGQGDMIWRICMKAGQRDRSVPAVRRTLPDAPVSRNAQPGAHGRGGWRNQPQATGARASENVIIEASNVERGSRLH